MSRRSVFALVAVLAVATIIIGCATAPSPRISTIAPAATQPEVVTRVYDIRDLIGGKPDFNNAPDFNIAGGMVYARKESPANADDSVLLPPANDEQLVIVEKQKAPANPVKTQAGHDLSDQTNAHERGEQEEDTSAATRPAARLEKAVPGSGALLANLPDHKQIPIPLKHTDVHADILGYISTVDVTQQYTNPYNEKIEAVYVFPLPQDAAVSDFVMTIGDRKIRGIIREKEEAQRIYNAAKAQGYVASLMTQDRPNIFTQSVANIEPGKQIDVNIRYFNTLRYADGWYEFTFPMVVGPRFNPPGSTDGIGAVGRGDLGASGQSKEIQYLRPDERSGHDIALSVNINAGVTIEKIESVNHHIVQKVANGATNVELASDDTIPNKDFVLHYKVAGDHLKSALITQRDQRGGFFTLMLYPPDSLKDIPRTPVEMVFTLDVSGSMSGQPIEQSRAAIRYALTHMRPDDTFQIIRFAGNTEMMSPRALPATTENIEHALQQISQMQAGGGTMMLDGIRQSLNFTRDPSRSRYLTFLTDGYIGNETEILEEIHKSRAGARIFSFGVGSSPNRYLLDGMARIGAGTAAYLSLNDDASKVMAEYFQRISHPAMSDISVDFGSMQATDVFPQRIPDLFVGRPVVITGRFTGQAPDTIRVHGNVGGNPQEIVVKTNPIESGAKNALPAVWARAKISDLSDSALDVPGGLATELPTQIKNVAMEFGLMSAYTSFVAVDSSQVTKGDHGTSVNVPLPVPDGVRYDTTVMEGSKEAKHVE